MANGRLGPSRTGRRREEAEERELQVSPFHWVTTRSTREHLKVLNGPEHLNGPNLL